MDAKAGKEFIWSILAWKLCLLKGSKHEFGQSKKVQVFYAMHLYI